jgi:hypothetical protein
MIDFVGVRFKFLGKWDRLSSLSEQPGKAVPQIWYTLLLSATTFN